MLSDRGVRGVLTCLLQAPWVGAQAVWALAGGSRCQVVARSQGAGLSKLPEVCHQKPTDGTGGQDMVLRPGAQEGLSWGCGLGGEAPVPGLFPSNSGTDPDLGPLLPPLPPTSSPLALGNPGPVRGSDARTPS